MIGSYIRSYTGNVVTIQYFLFSQNIIKKNIYKKKKIEKKNQKYDRKKKKSKIVIKTVSRSVFRTLSSI